MSITRHLRLRNRKLKKPTKPSRTCISVLTRPHLHNNQKWFHYTCLNVVDLFAKFLVSSPLPPRDTCTNNIWQLETAAQLRSTAAKWVFAKLISFHWSITFPFEFNPYFYYLCLCCVATISESLFHRWEVIKTETLHLEKYNVMLLSNTVEHAELYFIPLRSLNAIWSLTPC
jgi:hypothetical protein